MDELTAVERAAAEKFAAIFALTILRTIESGPKLRQTGVTLPQALGTLTRGIQGAATEIEKLVEIGHAKMQ